MSPPNSGLLASRHRQGAVGRQPRSPLSILRTAHPPLAYARGSRTTPHRPETASESQQLSIPLRIGRSAGEVVEGDGGGVDQVPDDKPSAFDGALFGALDGALPFQDGPSAVPGFGE